MNNPRSAAESLLVIKIRVVFTGALRAQGVSKIRLRMLLDVDLNLAPETPVVSNLLTKRADRYDTAQGFETVLSF